MPLNEIPFGGEIRSQPLNENFQYLNQKSDDIQQELNTHKADKANPHNVTTEQVNSLGINMLTNEDDQSKYPVGLSIMRVSDGFGGFPENFGNLQTNKTTNTTATQLFFGTGSSNGVYVRRTYEGNWQEWVRLDSVAVNTGFKNFIINGNFDIWQRGTEFLNINSSLEYTADRFQGYGTGYSGASAQRITLSLNDIPYKEIGAMYGLRYTRRSLRTHTLGMRQRVENGQALAGKTVTFSIYARAYENTTCRLLLRLHRGDGSNADHLTHINVSTNWEKFTFTTQLSELTELGESGNQLEVVFYAEAHQLRSDVDSWLETTGWQLEAGGEATDFEQRPRGLEMLLCQRYFQRRSSNNVDPIDLRPLMRVNPTVTYRSPVYHYDAEL